MRANYIIVAIFLMISSSVQAQNRSIEIPDYPRYATTLNPTQQDQLRRFAGLVVGALGAGQKVNVSVFGHADFDAQGRQFEIDVSQERANTGEAALRQMIQEEARTANLPLDRLTNFEVISSTGIGTLRPKVASPRSEADRRANRRIEIVYSAVPLPAPVSQSVYSRCMNVLRGASPPGPARRMTCVCDKLGSSPLAQDTHYEFSARQRIPGSAGMPNLTPEQWEAAMSELIQHMRPNIRAAADAARTDQDFQASLLATDDRVGVNINNFATAAAPDLNPGLFDRVVLADIKNRMANPNHIYSCYANYSRARHND